MSNFQKFLKIVQDLHLLLANREARVSGPSDSENSDFTPTTQWAAILAARQMTPNSSESPIAVYIYNQVRTHFIKNI